MTQETPKYTEEPNFIEETPNSITVINIILDIETQSLQSLSEFESRYSDWFIQSGKHWKFNRRRK